MTVSELARASSVKEGTVKRNLSKIPGVLETNGNLVIPDGTRYPYDTHRFKFTLEKCRYIILDATNKRRYIDHEMLAMSETEFQNMINRLVAAGFLQRNVSPNTLGANGYDTTFKYDTIREEKREKIIKIIADAIASVAGTAMQ